jgi:hypothetical protein
MMFGLMSAVFYWKNVYLPFVAKKIAFKSSMYQFNKHLEFVLTKQCSPFHLNNNLPSKKCPN